MIKLHRRSIRDINLSNQRVLLRVDFNVPMANNGEITITDDTRIRAALPTIQYCLQEGAKRIVIISHLGRPNGKRTEKYSLRPCANRLSELLCDRVVFVEDCINVQLGEEGVYLLENLRFYPEEEAGSDEFAKELSKHGDVFVNDAFGAAHRPHASISHISIPIRVCGLLLQSELESFGKLLTLKKIDLAILGGAKVIDKIVLIDELLERVGKVIIGGAMAFSFMKKNMIGDSLFDGEGAKHVEGILQKAKRLNVEIILPIDFTCAPSLNSTDVTVCTLNDGIPSGLAGFDIGPASQQLVTATILSSRSILWNGPMGVFESPQFSPGTITIIDALDKVTADSQAITVVGGGDTAAAVHLLRPGARLSHVSTGGGASLELMEGKALPGVEALLP